MKQGGDMIVSLAHLPAWEEDGEVKIKRAFAGDKEEILSFIRKRFSNNWVYEAERALMQDPAKLFIATKDGVILGFACFDASAKGFFGPMGVMRSARKQHVGTKLLLRTLTAMREFGYGYAIIGWVTDAAAFYSKQVGATYIQGGSPENSVYSDMIFM